MKRLYWRCNSGHYYSSLRCPFDGWTFDGCAELAKAAERVAQNGRALSITELGAEGVPSSALKRAVVIDFGSKAAAFEAFSPAGYVIDGRYKSIDEIDIDHR